MKQKDIDFKKLEKLSMLKIDDDTKKSLLEVIRVAQRIDQVKFSDKLETYADPNQLIYHEYLGYSFLVYQNHIMIIIM